MKKTAPFWWKIYLLIFAFFVLANLTSLLSPSSIVYGYFHSLITFDKLYRFPYSINILCAILNVLAVIPVYLFVFRVRLLTPHFWQWFVFIRLAFDLFGHSYEMKVLESFFRTDLEIALSTSFIWAVLLFPSYIACLQYAFWPEKLFRENRITGIENLSVVRPREKSREG